MYQPEASTLDSNLFEIDLYGWIHLMKCLTTSISENGVGTQIKKEAWVNLAESGATEFNLDWFNQDKQRVEDAYALCVVKNKAWLRTNGWTKEAEVTQKFRRCSEAMDKKGLTDLERVKLIEDFLGLLRVLTRARAFSIRYAAALDNTVPAVRSHHKDGSRSRTRISKRKLLPKPKPPGIGSRAALSEVPNGSETEDPDCPQTTLHSTSAKKARKSQRLSLLKAIANGNGIKSANLK
ncbi:hypothetical protein BDR26DRAFT_897779 [Obelidium mucronatum]|nr:hypothetical protein BDR26DRAFT_897779 [Obelidium mucronatum]